MNNHFQTSFYFYDNEGFLFLLLVGWLLGWFAVTLLGFELRTLCMLGKLPELLFFLFIFFLIIT